jgi:hypothetical protein
VKEQELSSEERQRLQTVIDDLTSKLGRSQDDLGRSNNITQSLQRDLNSIKGGYNSLELLMRDQAIELERLKSEIISTKSERDSLLALSEHQRLALQTQSLRSEDSLKTLWERQESLERVEREASCTVDQLLNIQEGLQNLLAHEGTLVHSELLSAKKLTGMLAGIREKISETNSIRAELEHERSLRIQLQQELSVDSHTIISSELEKANNVFEQLSKYRKAAEASEAKAQYWQSVAQKVSATPHPAILNSLSSSEQLSFEQENVILRNQLADSMADAATAKANLEQTQENMQREFASLWIAVQELNKLDAAKEKALGELINDRDRILSEKILTDRRVDELMALNNQLQSDLEARYYFHHIYSSYLFYFV